MPAPKIKSVLLVDDDPDICELVQGTLSLIAGLKVHTVKSGEQAIELAHALRPDLVLMDVMMPGLDGPATLKCMHEHALLTDVPVIFLTAAVLPAEQARLLHLGAIGVIGKPFDPVKLCDEVFALWRNVQPVRDSDDSLAAESQVRAQVRSLTDSFLERTRSDVVRLRTIIEAGHEDRSVLEEAQRVAHSIHGAGGMFGFPGVSAAGGAIERLLGRALARAAAGPSTGEPAVLRQLLDCTAQLADEIDAAGPPACSGAGMFQELGGGSGTRGSPNGAS